MEDLINENGAHVFIVREWLENSDCFYKLFAETVPWERAEIQIMGKPVKEARHTCSYGSIKHKYSGITRKINEWSEEILSLKKLVEEITESEYNSCLLNYYKNGSEYIGYHSDKEIVKNSDVATISLGSKRDFYFKRKNTKGETIKTYLDSGDLCVMNYETQKLFTHSIPKRTSRTEPIGGRISLTFRTLKND